MNTICYGLSCVPSKYIETLTPEPQNVTLFGNRVIADALSSVKIGCQANWMRMGSQSSKTNVLDRGKFEYKHAQKKDDVKTHRRQTATEIMLP